MKKLLLTGALLMALPLTSCDFFEMFSSDPLPMTYQEAKVQLDQLAEDGFEVTYHYTDGDEQDGHMTLGQKDDVFWLLSQTEGGVIYAKVGSTYQKFEQTVGENGEVTVELDDYVDQETFELGKEASCEWLYYVYHLEGTLKKVKGEGYNTTVCGRECVNYEFAYSSFLKLVGVKLDIVISIDVELGIVMKIKMEGENDDKEEVNLDFEITSFLRGNQVTIPSFPMVYGNGD